MTKYLLDTNILYRHVIMGRNPEKLMVEKYLITKRL